MSIAFFDTTDCTATLCCTYTMTVTTGTNYIGYKVESRAERQERKRFSRVFDPAPRSITRRPQVMHGRHPLACLPRSSC